MVIAVKLDYVQCPVLCSVHKFKLWTFFKKKGAHCRQACGLYVVFLKTDRAN